MSERLKKKNACKSAKFFANRLVQVKRAGLDTTLVLLGLMGQQLSAKFAVVAWAREVMLVMPFWTRVIGDATNALFHGPGSNLRFGCGILRHYLDREKRHSWVWAAWQLAWQISVPDAVLGASH
jgi:soluble lytic murein transglycosylase-like protein